MNESELASFSMNLKEPNDHGPMNSTFRTPSVSTQRPSVFQSNSNTSNSLKPLQPVTASSLTSVVADNPVLVESKQRSKINSISSVKSDKVME